MNQQERPPLKTITTSGVYQLRLCKPKPEKYKLNGAGYPAVWIFFMDAEGNCLSKHYTVQYGKSLAMLVGKLTGKFTNEPPESSSKEQMAAFIDQAVNCIGEFDVEVTEGEPWNGKPQYKYKFKSVKQIVALQKPDEKPSVPFDEANPPF